MYSQDDKGWWKETLHVFRCVCRIAPFDEGFQEDIESSIVSSPIAINQQAAFDNLLWKRVAEN
jgi:hypothetical protein